MKVSLLQRETCCMFHAVCCSTAYNIYYHSQFHLSLTLTVTASNITWVSKCIHVSMVPVFVLMLFYLNFAMILFSIKSKLIFTPHSFCKFYCTDCSWTYQYTHNNITFLIVSSTFYYLWPSLKIAKICNKLLHTYFALLHLFCKDAIFQIFYPNIVQILRVSFTAASLILMKKFLC